MITDVKEKTADVVFGPDSGQNRGNLIMMSSCIDLADSLCWKSLSDYISSGPIFLH